MNRRYVTSIASWDIWDETTLTSRQKAVSSALREVVREHGKFLQGDGPEGAGYRESNLDLAASQSSCKDCVFSLGVSCEIINGEIASNGRCNFGVFGEPNDAYLEDQTVRKTRFRDE